MRIIQNSSNTVQSLWIGLGSLSAFALAIVSSAVLSRYLTKSEYGTYKQVIYIYTTLLVVFSAGLPKVFAYFLPKYSLAEGKFIVGKVTKFLFFSGLLFSTIIFFGSSFFAYILNNEALESNLKIFSPVPLLLLPTLGIEGIFSTYKKAIYIAVYNVTTRILTLLFITLPVILYKPNCSVAIYGWVIVSILSLIIALFFKQLPFKGVAKIEEFGLTSKTILSYSIPILLASLSGIAIKSADQFFISKYFGPEIFAEFSNGFIEIPFVAMITSATSTVTMPAFSKMVHERAEKNKMTQLWQNVLIKSAYLIYPIVVFCLFNSTNIMNILYSENYSNSSIYFQISMLVNFFNIIIFAPLIMALGKIKFYSNMHLVFALLIWVLGYFTILIFQSPISYAMLSVTLSCLRVLVALMYISWVLKIKLQDLFPIRLSSAIILQCSVILLMVNFLFKNFCFIGNYMIIVKLVLYVLVLMFSANFFKLDYLSVIKPIFNRNV